MEACVRLSEHGDRFEASEIAKALPRGWPLTTDQITSIVRHPIHAGVLDRVTRPHTSFFVEDIEKARAYIEHCKTMSCPV